MYERMINPHTISKYSIDIPAPKTTPYQLGSKSKESVRESSGFMNAIIEEEKFVENSDSESEVKEESKGYNIPTEVAAIEKRVKSMKNIEQEIKFNRNKEDGKTHLNKNLLKKGIRSKSPEGIGIDTDKNPEAAIISSASENQIRRFAVDHESETPLDQHYFDSATEESDSNTEEQEEAFNLYDGNSHQVYNYRRGRHQVYKLRLSNNSIH